MNWDDVVGNFYFLKKFDFVAGMEITDKRRESFVFTLPYYNRRIAVFIRADDVFIERVEDLIGRKITGDRGSGIESVFSRKGILDKIRIYQTATKKESMELLKLKKTDAMVAPKEVGIYLARQYDLKVKILVESERATPVGIAVRKGNFQLLNMLEATLKKLIDEGKITALYEKWFGPVKPGIPIH